MARITIEDVASAAGVSVTTVSHVYSGHRPVKLQTREHVRRIATELGYRPSAVAKSLRVQRTDTIMIILPDITNPFYPGFARGVQDALRGHGYHALLCNTDAVEADERAFIEEALERRVDGVVFVGWRVGLDELDVLTDAEIAVVSLGQPPEPTLVDSIWLDDVASAREATEYLVQTYGPNIAHLAGPSDTPVGVKREQGYRLALEGAGIAVNEDAVVRVEFTHEGGLAGMPQLLARSSRPRAVFCANDLIALGAIRVAREQGLQVPGDIAVMGVDDIEVAAIANPSLTTVRQRVHELGTLCGERLLERLTGTYAGPGRSTFVQHEIVLRESA